VSEAGALGATPRIRAPELRGRGWLNTGGRRLSLADLRGRIVLLDFWTFCCVNCLHVVDELRPIEQRYADVLVVVGVHSPKFEHEKDPAALAAAVQRYGVHHPVLDDPDLVTWGQYAARAWPTLCVVDPEGYVVATMAGEGHAAGLAALVDELVEVHEAKGTLVRGAGPYVAPPVTPGVLHFPGKAIVAPAGGFLVSSSAAHQLVELGPDASTAVRRIGSGQRGRADGDPSVASLNEPQGLLALPSRVAGAVGYDLVVADTVNHLLRGVRLSDGYVSTVAGTGRPWRMSTVDTRPHDALALDLSSPWDLAWYDDRVIVAMAGIHQLWWFDPAKRTVGVYAGTTVEALRDGPLAQAWLAQPSGLSTVDSRLWMVDSESSALRFVCDGSLFTVAGQGLFDFGQVDGPATEALFQHPLGVLALPDGSVLVADTYNGAVRRYADGEVSTVDSGLAEPSDLVRTPSGDVYVVESGAHRLTLLAPATIAPSGQRYRTERPPTVLAPGEVHLEVVFTPAPGQKLDDSFGVPTRMEVSASPPGLLLDGSGVSTGLSRTLRLADLPDGGVIQVTAQAATCDADAEHAACHLTRQDWGVPVRLAPDGPSELRLMLRVDAG
jgi:thiol-disulfide isomerase/thioredoxin